MTGKGDHTHLGDQKCVLFDISISYNAVPFVLFTIFNIAAR